MSGLISLSLTTLYRMARQKNKEKTFHLASWLMEQLEEKDEKEVNSKELYAKYEEASKELGIEKRDARHLGITLIKLFPNIKKRRTSVKRCIPLSKAARVTEITRANRGTHESVCYYGGITFKNRIWEKRLEFKDVARTVTDYLQKGSSGFVIGPPPVGDKFTFYVTSNLLCNGNMVLKKVEIDTEVRIFVRQKEIDLEKVLICATAPKTAVEAEALVDTVKKLRICLGTIIDEDSRQHVFPSALQEKVSVSNEIKEGIFIRTTKCDQVVTWTSLDVCHACQAVIAKAM